MFSQKRLDRLSEFESTSDFCTRSVNAIIKDDADRIAVLFDTRRNQHGLPGGKIDAGEDAFTTLQRELWEEIGGQLFTMGKPVAGSKQLRKGGRSYDIITECTLQNTDNLISNEAHSLLKWAEIYETNNGLGYGIKVGDRRYENDRELLQQFYDITAYLQRDRLGLGDYALPAITSSDVFDAGWYVQYLDLDAMKYKNDVYTPELLASKNVVPTMIMSGEHIREYCDYVLE